MLLCLSPDERSKAAKFYFLKDAKLSLGSALLKRLFLVNSLNVRWVDVQFERLGNPKHGKPCYKAPDGQPLSVDFNVSHQAGLVALVGSTVANIQLGVDVTCVNERNDQRSIEQEGFEAWVDMHAEVFSEQDLQAMKASIPGLQHPHGLQTGIRTFYAYWALKEAYVKLEGEALLAKWLKDVEFRNVRVPRPATGKGMQGRTRISGIEVWIKNKRRADVEMSLESFEENYLIATALKNPNESSGLNLPAPELLDLDKDILPFTAEF